MVLLSYGAACSDAVTAPPEPLEGSFTVDASTRWVYVSLQDSSIVTPTPSPRESASWDIGFFTTSVTLNGGAAGPGAVTGACVCQNAAATDAQILAMTAESETADFDAVTVPASASFVTDQLTPAMAGWYTGSGASATAVASRAFLLRLADGSSFAKGHVVAIQGASATSAGRVTLEYAVQTSATAAFGGTKTITLDGTTATASAAGADLNADANSVTPTDWDLRVDGWNILVNGGVSGPGAAGIASTTASFDSITTASTVSQAYRTDVYAGIFGSNRWYKYNLAGDNRISPTYDVYLLKRGTTVYKLQITNYYSATNQPRHITFRYKRIAG